MVIFALLSALTAALVAILAKLGLQTIDPTLATTIRSIIFVILLAVLFWGEKLGWKLALGGLLMVVGAILITLK